MNEKQSFNLSNRTCSYLCSIPFLLVLQSYNIKQKVTIKNRALDIKYVVSSKK